MIEACSSREKSRQQREIEDLRSRLGEAEETLRAIRQGEVDSLLVSTDEGDRIYTLKSADYFYRALVEQMGEGAVTINEDGAILYCNRRFAQMLALPLEQVMGDDIRSLIAPRDRADFYAMLLSKTDERREMETALVSADGKLIPVRLSLSFIPYETPPSFCLVVTDMTESRKREDELREAQDNLEQRVARRTADLVAKKEELEKEVAERKRAEEALIISQKHLVHLFTVIPTVVYTLDPESLAITWVSPNIMRVLGYTPEEALKPSWWRQHLHPEDREKAMIAGGEIRAKYHVELEYRFKKKDGEYIWIRDELLMVPDARGNPVEIVGARIDASERRQMEEQRRKLEAQLYQARKLEAIGTLAGGVAHDFNNLLTTILGHAGMLLMELRKDDPLYEDMIEIKKAGERGADLTRRLLAFSRKETRRPELLDLNQTVGEMEKMLRRLIREDIELVISPGRDLGPVYMDPTQMDQIIMNLVVNARDAMPDGGTLTIETANVELDRAYFWEHGIENQPGSYVMLAVTDTGIGMDEETKAQIFDPFFTTKDRRTGTGLGLATVYGIVKQNRGYIWTYSEPGQGATMKVYLPRAGEVLEPRRSGDMEAEGGLTGTETILVVEDNEQVLSMTLKILDRYGYRTLAARAGDEAVRVSRDFEGKIHLLLTDVIMPGMSGKELAERLRSERPDMKVLFMSGYTQNIIIQKGVLPADIHYIQKPFSTEGLARKVRESLRD